MLLFLDGTGLGPDEPSTNPFARARTPALEALAGGRWLEDLPARVEAARVVATLDATLGDPGLPQSATGQTTLLTGHDAVAAMGRPYGPWPGPTLTRLLEASSLFHEAPDAALANAYPLAYLSALATPTGRRRRHRPPAAIVAARGAGVALRGTEALVRGRAVAADLGYFGALAATDVGAGAPVAARGAHAAVAAVHLAALAADHAFTYLDVWAGDHTGHLADLEKATAWVEHLDAFVAALLPALGTLTLLVVSDHGNLEDASTTRHTRARVPLVAFGPRAAAFEGATDLRDVAPGVRRAWSDDPATDRPG